MLKRIHSLGVGVANIDDLRAHLQVAIELEHATIPPYLCALYSLHGTGNETAAYVVRSVVLEEMLHMSLAANILNAIGGAPVIDKAEFIPRYPATLPDSRGTFGVSLLAFSRQALETFLRIELPEKVGSRPEADCYQTIGQFYRAIEDGLREVCANDRHFTRDHARQIASTEYYGSDGQLTPVTDLSTAIAALETIRHQGEGLHETLTDGDPGMFGSGRNYAHYFRFNELLQGRFYDSEDSPASSPSGKPLMVDEDAVYPMRANPRAADYPAGSELRDAADKFNRAYTGMLRSLHRAFNGEPLKMRECVVAMYGLRHQATALMRIPFGQTGETAGPCFEYC